jgi:hypothetical protein
MADDDLQHAGMGDQHGVLQAFALDLRDEVLHPCPQLRDRFALGRRIAQRVGGPAIQGFALDLVPRPHFPGAEVHFLQTRIAAWRRVQGVRQLPAALQRAGEHRRLYWQLRPDARRRGGGVLRQCQVGAAVADAGGHLRRRVADQVKLHSSPR